MLGAYFLYTGELIWGSNEGSGEILILLWDILFFILIQ